MDRQRERDQEEFAMRGVRIAVVVGALLWAPATAAAAEKPVVTTGAVSNNQPTTAVLNGRVNPKQAETTYFFQYGTTSLFGVNTASTAAGSGNAGVRVSAAISALAPNTTYHYRLVAMNSKGITRGKRRTFKTRRQPLGVSLAATPNPVRAGGVTTLAGVLSGTGNAGRQVVLKSNPWPYTQGFLPVGNVLVTNADGSFTSTLPSVPVTTQFLVQMPAKPEIFSPIVVVGATVKVTRRARVVRRNDRSGRVRFRGRVRPAVDGRQVVIQKLDRKTGAWENVGSTVTRHRGSASSSYRKTLRQRRGGRYRAVVVMDDQYTSSASRSIKVRRVRD
jgi:hypothetical protein